MLEKTLESPWSARRWNKSPKRNQPWIFIGRTDTEAEAPILWLPDAKCQLTGKDPDVGKDFKAKHGLLSNTSPSADTNLRSLDCVTLHTGYYEGVISFISKVSIFHCKLTTKQKSKRACGIYNREDTDVGYRM